MHLPELNILFTKIRSISLPVIPACDTTSPSWSMLAEHQCCLLHLSAGEWLGSFHPVFKGPLFFRALCLVFYFYKARSEGERRDYSNATNNCFPVHGMTESMYTFKYEVMKSE